MRTLGMIASQDDLLSVVRGRLKEIGASLEAIEDLSGLASGHLRTIIAPGGARTFGRMSLGVILSVLGITLTAQVDDADWERRYRHRLIPRAKRPWPPFEGGTGRKPEMRVIAWHLLSEGEQAVLVAVVKAQRSEQRAARCAAQRSGGQRAPAAADPVAPSL